MIKLIYNLRRRIVHLLPHKNLHKTFASHEGIRFIIYIHVFTLFRIKLNPKLEYSLIYMNYNITLHTDLKI